MLVPLANGGLNALGENRFRVFGTLVLSQGLRVHLITGNVVGIALDERAEVGFGGGEVAFAYTFERGAVAGEDVIWILCEKLFKLLTNCSAAT